MDEVVGTHSPMVYRPADQAVIHDGDALRLVVMMDDEPPADSNYRIQLLAPVSAEVGQPASFDIYWRGQRPPGWPRTVQPPKSDTPTGHDCAAPPCPASRPLGR